MVINNGCKWRRYRIVERKVKILQMVEMMMRYCVIRYDKWVLIILNVETKRIIRRVAKDEIYRKAKND